MSKTWAKGSTRAWRRLRDTILARDGYRCRLRLPGEWVNRKGQHVRCKVVADCVHHTLGKSITGDDPRYLVAACTPCNLKVGEPAKQPDPAPQPRTKW